MPHRILRKWLAAFAAVISLPASWLLAQELPKSDDAFEVEPPLLIPPFESEKGADSAPAESPETERDVGKLAQQLERAKASAASAERLVKKGVLAKVEAEQRALRVVRLESALVNAQLVAAQEQVASLQARKIAGQVSQTDLDSAMAALASAKETAQAGKETYRKAQLEAAELDLRRQRQLLAQGSARNSDVARAEEKLAQLQRDEQPSP